MSMSPLIRCPAIYHGLRAPLQAAHFPAQAGDSDPGRVRRVKMYTVHDADTGACVIAAVSCADTHLERLRGLLGRPPLAGGEALLLTPCSSVHTCFMTYAIDIVYVDRELQVLKVVPSLPPWRMSVALGAAMTFELPAGQAAACALTPGRRLQLVSI